MTVPIVSATLVWALFAYFFFPGGVLPILSVGSLLSIACLLTNASVKRPQEEYEESKVRSSYKFLDDDRPLRGSAE